MPDDTNAETSSPSGWGEVFDALPLDELKSNFTDYVSAWGEKAIHGLGDKVTGLIDNITSGQSGSGAMGQAAQEGAQKLAEGDSPVTAGLSGAASGVKEKVKETFGGGSGGSGGGGKFSNIVESVDVGVPISVAYNQWTQFQDWSDFMKKVESVEQESDEKINFKGQVFWSHRTWEATIIQQVPDEQIVWRSTGEKGHLDGAVTFHELGPRLTRILAVVVYYPQGFMEKTGNIWRAVGRRVQVEFKRYVRQIMTTTILDPDSVEGWRGEIRDSEIVRTHEEAAEEEQQQTTEPTEETQAEDTAPEAEDEGPPAEDEPVEEEPVDEEPAAEDEAPVEDEPVNEVEDEEPPAEDEPVEDEPVDEVEGEEPPAEDEPVEDEPVDEEPSTEDESVPEQPDNADEPLEDEPTEDEVVEEAQKVPAKSSRAKTTKSTPKKRSTSSKSGSGSKSTRSTSKGKTTKSS